MLIRLGYICCTSVSIGQTQKCQYVMWRKHLTHTIKLVKPMWIPQDLVRLCMMQLPTAMLLHKDFRVTLCCCESYSHIHYTMRHKPILLDCYYSHNTMHALLTHVYAYTSPSDDYAIRHIDHCIMRFSLLLQQGVQWNMPLCVTATARRWVNYAACHCSTAEEGTIDHVVVHQARLMSNPCIHYCEIS